MASAHALAAASWWAALLRAPPEMNNGDGFQSAFASTAAARVYKPRSEEDIARFRDILAAKIDASIEKYRAVRPRLYIGVDYHACEELHAAATEAKLPGYDDMLTFPFKTGMGITESAVEVKEGYGAPWKTIWEARHA